MVGNNMIILKDAAKSAVDDYIRDRVEKGSAFGTTGHSEEISKISHIWRRLWWEGDNLMGEADILDNDEGHSLVGLLKTGKLGVSVAWGSTETGETHKNVKGTYFYVYDDILVSRFDIVVSPALGIENCYVSLIKKENNYET
jgi:hypothetical protein